MEFKQFLMNEYSLNEKSANDYVGRINGVLEKGIYRGEFQITPSLEMAIEKHYAKSKGHYLLALKRYIKFKEMKEV